MNWTPSYVTGNGMVGFSLGNFDAGKELVVEIGNDPESVACEPDNITGIEYSTYYGSESTEQAYDLTGATPTFGINPSDLPGEIFITGETSSSQFPTVDGPIDDFAGDFSNAFVISIDGIARDWVTFFGGFNSAGDLGMDKGATIGHHIAYDESNEKIYFCGRTNSIDLPGANPDDGPTNQFLFVPFLAQLDVDGERDFATYFAGGGLSGSATSVKVNSNGHVFMAGYSQNDIPVTPLNMDSYNDSNNDGEGFIAEYNLENTLVWSARFGRLDTKIRDMDIFDNSLVLVGDHSPINVEAEPIDYVNQPLINDYFDDSNDNGNDAFIAKFDIENSNRTLVWATVFSGNGNDDALSVRFNDGGNSSSLGDIYFLGNTTSTAFPTMGSNATTTNSGETDLYVSRFSNDGELKYSGFFGGSQTEGDIPFASDIDFDIKGNFYLTSVSKSSDFPIDFSSGTYNQSVLGNGLSADSKNDAVIVCLDKDMDVKWSTYFGGTNESANFGDVGTGIAIVGERIYLTGNTQTDCDIKIPLVDNGAANYFADALNGFDDTFITVFSAETLTSVSDEISPNTKSIFKIYPNPTSAVLTLENNSQLKEDVHLIISDVFGRTILNDFFPSMEPYHQFEIDVSKLQNGHYYLMLKTETESSAQKLIIAKSQ